MDGLIQPGHTLRMVRAGAVLTVEKRIGEGGQGVVHVARLNGAPFAVKWFRPGPGNEEMRKSITALIQRGRPPHQAFVWPIDLVSSDRLPGFGYVMPLLEPRFISLAQLLNQEMQPSFRVITTIGRELVDAFAALHSAGLCYRDISFGNLRVDPAACGAAIIDVDNVGVDGGPVQVKGTGPFMAPEILRDEALPSTVTDLHSLAVLLFYLLMHGHPLLGLRADASYTWDGGHSRRPNCCTELRRPPAVHLRPGRPGEPADARGQATWWPIYPVHSAGHSPRLSRWGCMRRPFTAGYREDLAAAAAQPARLRWPCPACGVAVFTTWNGPTNAAGGAPAPAGAAPARVAGRHPGAFRGRDGDQPLLFRDREYRTPARRRTASRPSGPGDPEEPDRQDLDGRPGGRDPKRVPPSMRLGVRPMTSTSAR